MSRLNNIDRHITDAAKAVSFDPTGSGFPSTINNVQDALSMIGEWALTNNGLPIASYSLSGISKYATTDEMNAGQSTTSVTPEKSNEYFRTHNAQVGIPGTIKIAPANDVQVGTNQTDAVVPSTLKTYYGNFMNSTQIYYSGTGARTNPISMSIKLSGIGGNKLSIQSDGLYGTSVDAFTKAESDARYEFKQPSGVAGLYAVGAYMFCKYNGDLGPGQTVYGQQLNPAGIHNDMQSSRTAEISAWIDGELLPSGTIWMCCSRMQKGNSWYALGLFRRIG